MKTLRISMVQMNPTVGDLAGNRDIIVEHIGRAKKLGADIVAFPEMALTGYPPEDLLLKPQFIKDTARVLREITVATKGITAVVGYVDRDEFLYNAAAILHNGTLAYVYHKVLLPNYGVFDEYRYFRPGHRYPVLTVRGVKVGVNICEDIWFAEGPTRSQAKGGAEVIVNINASPYHKGKGRERLRMLTERAKQNNVIISYTNAVGGQDELVFDGQSMVIDQRGKLLAMAGQFVEEMLTVDLRVPDRTPALSEVTQKDFASLDPVVLSEKQGPKKRPLPPARRIERALPLCEEIYHALVLGTRDYLGKTGFTKAVVGLSGGVDSALVAAIAAEALGPEHVVGVFMPSQYSSDASRVDAYELAKNLGIRILELPIQDAFDAYLRTLRCEFARTKQDVTEENLQARIRGNLLMALSNKFGWIVLTTGNKSEMSVGYATLYGDMAGGFAVIKDVPKTMVYDICRCINRLCGRTVIPKRVMTKAPTAELRPDQKDSDSLPVYPVLDPILKAYVEDDKDFKDMLKMGFDRKTVEKVIRLVDSSEYKRRQAPPGVKITPRGLGKDRRFPITNRYRSY